MTVQTVLSRYNDNARTLLDFARVVHGWGVKNWVIHVTAVAGKAGVLERIRSLGGRSKEASILPESGGLKTLRALKRMILDAKIPIDLRVTDANPIRHAVFLVNSEGDLYTEGMAKLGKKLSFKSSEIVRDMDIWKDVDSRAHTARYSNWIDGLFPNQTLSELCHRLLNEDESPRDFPLAHPNG